MQRRAAKAKAPIAITPSTEVEGSGTGIGEIGPITTVLALTKLSFELWIDRFRSLVSPRSIAPIRALDVGFHPRPREGLPAPYKDSIAVKSKRN